MYEIFTNNKIVSIMFILTVLIVALFIAIKKMQDIGLEKIREDVYALFVEAEKDYQNGEQKFEYVIKIAKTLIPYPYHLLITDKLLRKVVQLWFDLCKDLLDDGKLNATSKK